MEKSRVLVVIVIASPAQTATALRTAGSAVAALDGLNGCVTLVGTGSRDGSARIVRDALRAGEWQDRVRFIDPVGPTTRAAGTNIGISAGLPDGQVPDYICLLAPGALPAPDAVHALIAHLDAHPKAGIAGSALFAPDGTDRLSAFRFPAIPGEFNEGAGHGPVWRLLRRRAWRMPLPKTSGPVDWVDGTALMLRRRALDDTGILDEDYAAAFADTDLCRRARSAGWATRHVRESHVDLAEAPDHAEAIRQRAAQEWMDARLRYFRVHHGRVYAGLATLARVAGGVFGRLAGRRPRPDPPGFTRALILHDASAAWRGLWRLLGRLAPSAPHRTVPAPRRSPRQSPRR